MPDKSILIVDDDVDFSQELSEMLAAQGYAPDVINDGFAAYQQLLQKNYDLILLDFKMPGLNGIDLLKLVRKSKPLTKVLMVSGRPFIEKLVETELQEKLIHGIINKPFQEAEFLDKINEVFTEKLDV
jgi:DNA-binding response OmpR family regulator